MAKSLKPEYKWLNHMHTKINKTMVMHPASMSTQICIAEWCVHRSFLKYISYSCISYIIKCTKL